MNIKTSFRGQRNGVVHQIQYGNQNMCFVMGKIEKRIKLHV